MNKSSEQLNELFAALAKAQSALQTASKDNNNPFFKSKYSTLDSCWESARVPLTSNGLSVIQTISEENGRPYLTTILAHSSGQYITSTAPIMALKQDPQAFGSALTYQRRYSFCALVGITSGEDDDGEKAMGRHDNASRTNKPTQPDSKPAQEQIIDSTPSYEEFCETLRGQTEMSFSGILVDKFLESLTTKNGAKPLPVGRVMTQALKQPDRFITSYNEWRSANEVVE